MDNTLLTLSGVVGMKVCTMPIVTPLIQYTAVCEEGRRK